VDDADRAKDYEMKDRNAALQAALKRDSLPAQRRNKRGEIICIDCEQRIEPERLAVRPEAVRCVSCKQEWETRRRG